MGIIPWRLSETPFKGGYLRYHSILLSPLEGFSLLVPLPLHLSASLPPKFLPISFLCGIFLLGLELHWMQKLPLIKEFIKVELIKKYSNLLIIVIWLNYMTVVNYRTLRY